LKERSWRRIGRASMPLLNPPDHRARRENFPRLNTPKRPGGLGPYTKLEPTRGGEWKIDKKKQGKKKKSSSNDAMTGPGHRRRWAGRQATKRRTGGRGEHYKWKTKRVRYKAQGRDETEARSAK